MESLGQRAGRGGSRIRGYASFLVAYEFKESLPGSDYNFFYKHHLPSEHLSPDIPSSPHPSSFPHQYSPQYAINTSSSSVYHFRTFYSD